MLLERRTAKRTQELAQARATAERLRAEAEDADRMKDLFLAKVSHGGGPGFGDAHTALSQMLAQDDGGACSPTGRPGRRGNLTAF